MAIERRAGETAAAIDVPSVSVRVISRVVGTSCAAIAAAPIRTARTRRSTQSPQSTQSYFFRVVFPTAFTFDAPAARPAFFVTLFVTFAPSVSFVPGRAVWPARQLVSFAQTLALRPAR